MGRKIVNARLPTNVQKKTPPRSIIFRSRETELLDRHGESELPDVLPIRTSSTPPHGKLDGGILSRHALRSCPPDEEEADHL